MNYLAHIVLSGSDRKRQLGNFIGDAVKGNGYTQYPQAIAQGILLHRRIDAYTDNHPAVREAVQWLKPHFGRYSSVLLDIYFDYLLASRFEEFSKLPLKRYARRFYLTMIWNRPYLPRRIKDFMWHFIGTNRLSRYAAMEGIRESLSIMVKFHRLHISVDEAIDYLKNNEEKLWAVFRPLFGDLQTFCYEAVTTPAPEISGQQ